MSGSYLSLIFCHEFVDNFSVFGYQKLTLERLMKLVGLTHSVTMKREAKKLHRVGEVNLG